MRYQFARGKMFMFHHTDERGVRLGLRSETDNRLPLGMSVTIIAGLSALSWAVLISIIVGLRTVL